MKKPLLQFLTFALVFLISGIDSSFSQGKESVNPLKTQQKKPKSNITYLDSYISQPNVGNCFLVTVFFEVKDEAGNSIADAVVTLNDVEKSNGDYVFNGIEEGTYDYTVIKDGYIRVDGEVVVTLESSEQSVSIMLVVETFTITFSIVDVDENEITDAVVTFNGDENDAGDYIFEDIEAGTYDYRVEKDGYITIENQHTITEDAAVNVTLEVETFTITFSIEDVDENEITDAVVTFNGVENDAGDYIFEDIEAGTYDYRVEKDGYITIENQHTITEDAAVNVTLEVETFTITFSIEDVDENEIAGAVVTFNGEENDAGDYIFEDIAVGTYDYRVEKDGYITIENQHTITEDGAVNVTLEVETFTITFSIEDVDENEIVDAVVTFNGVENDAGDYIFEDIEAGTYNYKVEKEGYTTIDDQTEVIDQNLTVNVTLTDATSAPARPLVEQWISLFPNPNTGQFTIELCLKPNENNIWLTVLDPTGRVVHRVQENAQGETFTKKLNLSFLSKGIYYINVQGNQRTGIRKLIIN